jgi:microtubule-associated serine/threonine kinase
MLGSGGPLEIKKHQFFQSIDWGNLLRAKVDLMPQLDRPDDTSYFDTRSERYNHDLDEQMKYGFPNSAVSYSKQ